jgi:hypothetical protein
VVVGRAGFCIHSTPRSRAATPRELVMAINIVDTRSCRYKVGCLVKSDVAAGANAHALALWGGPSTCSRRLYCWVLKCVGVPVEDYFVAGTLVDTYIYIEDPI